MAIPAWKTSSPPFPFFPPKLQMRFRGEISFIRPDFFSLCLVPGEPRETNGTYFKVTPRLSIGHGSKQIDEKTRDRLFTPDRTQTVCRHVLLQRYFLFRIR